MSEDRSTLLGGAPPSDAWSRRARQVRLLAGELGLPADAAALAACDTRDLVGLIWLLQELLAERGSGHYRRQLRRRAATCLGAPPRPPTRARLLRQVASRILRVRRAVWRKGGASRAAG